MSYTDSYGTWKLLGEQLLSKNSSFITVPSNPDKIIRFSYNVDWNQWDNNRFYQSKCLLRWHYGDNQDLHGFYFTLYPTKTSHVKQFSLLSESNLFPKELEAKLIPKKYKYYYHNVGLLPWTLKVEELLDDG